MTGSLLLSLSVLLLFYAYCNYTLAASAFREIVLEDTIVEKETEFIGSAALNYFD